MPFVFQYVFANVSYFTKVLLIVQSSLVVIQLTSLYFNRDWYKVLSEAILLFANYYLLFKSVRDFVVLKSVNDYEVSLKS